MKDLLWFANEVEELDPNFIAASFDVKSIFTNIPLTETIGLSLCFKNLYRKFKSILTSNTKTFPLHLKWNKMVHCHF